MGVPTINGLGLCAGIGGLERGLKLSLGNAYRPVCMVEREIYGCAVLAARMEDGSLDPCIYTDLESFDGRAWRGVVDLVSAGLPCQPYSVAGRQSGLEDERAYGTGDGPIPHTLRIIEECRPSLVFFENVPNWVLGGFFRPVGEELSRLGYRLEDPFFCRASDVGAPHRRERVFILALRDIGKDVANSNSNSNRCEGVGGGGIFNREREAQRNDADRRSGATVADASSARAGGERESLPDQQLETRRDGRGSGSDNRSREMGDTDCTGPQRRRSEGCSGPHELPTWPPGPEDRDGWRDYTERGGPLPYFCRSTHEFPHRLDRLRALGNSCVPQQAALAFTILIRRALKIESGTPYRSKPDPRAAPIRTARS